MSGGGGDTKGSGDATGGNDEARAKDAFLEPAIEPEIRALKGRGARQRVKRSSHGAWEPADGRPDPLELLGAQDETRVQSLLPIRYGRMSDSPFAFFRGSATIMAWDLGQLPTTRLAVQACGDAHLTNFGLFATPERKLVFDVNDFDETLPAPFEWDVKRLAASIAIAGRGNGFDEGERREATVEALHKYREMMRTFASAHTLEVWYANVDFDKLMDEYGDQLGKKARKRSEKRLKKVRSRTSLGSLDKLTEVVDGRRRIKERPHLVERIEPSSEKHLLEVVDTYYGSLPEERRVLAERLHFVDMAFKVVGVGSVGTRAWVLLLEGEGPGDDPVFLQLKEAGRSVLEPFTRRSRFPHQGQRVVTGQRITQAASDIFLGWTTGPRHGTHYYVRQLRDMKGSFEPEEMGVERLTIYATMCGATLARAHARSSDPAAIAGYLGKKETFDEAVADFAELYADQNERDYERLVEAIDEGRIEAQKGI
jgi:uncharacterized protein (DUF2252 family)